MSAEVVRAEDGHLSVAHRSEGGPTDEQFTACQQLNRASSRLRHLDLPRGLRLPLSHWLRAAGDRAFAGEVDADAVDVAEAILALRGRADA